MVTNPEKSQNFISLSAYSTNITIFHQKVINVQEEPLLPSSAQKASKMEIPDL
jgi:hypothetical protein